MSTSTTGLSPRSVIELPITQALAELYVGNEVVPGLFEPFRIWGRCSRMPDVARTDPPVGDGRFVLRFLAGWPGLFHAERGPADEPEYWMDLAEAPINTQLWHLTKDGSGSAEHDHDQKLAHFAGRHAGWHSFPAARERGLIPSAAAETQAGAVPRGLFATYQGTAYPADFGPDAGELTAYQTTPDGSVVPHGLTDAQCDKIEYRRTLATWRGVQLELLAVREQVATLAHVSGDAQQAAELGLTPAGPHAWRVQAPKCELENVIEESRTIE